MNRLFLLCVPALTAGSLPEPVRVPGTPLPFEVNTHQFLTALAFVTSRGFGAVLNGALATPDAHMFFALSDSAYDPIGSLRADPDENYYWDYMLRKLSPEVRASVLSDLGTNAAQRVMTWTSLGAVFEDFYSRDAWNHCDLAVRSRVFNHFFDEAHGGAALTMSAQSLFDWFGGQLGCTGNLRPVAAPYWSTTDPRNPQRLENALPLYREALTARTAGERRIAYFQLLRLLGQSVHLLQDMCQPSHTRNDLHPLHAALESWCAAHVHLERPTGDALLDLAPRPEDMPLFLRLLQGLDPQAQSFYAADIADYFVEASRFSGRCFYSDDTIDERDRPNPTYDVVPDPISLGLYRRSTSPANAGALLCWEGYEVEWIEMQPHHILTIEDDAVLRSNATHLLAKALEVSQSFFDNFFRGAIEVEAIDDDASGRIRIRNAADPAILRSRSGQLDLLSMRSGGTLSFYYYTSDHTLVPLLPPVHLDSDLAVDATKDLNVNPAVRLQRLRDGLEPGPQPAGNAVLVVFEGAIGPQPGIAFAHYDAEYVEPVVHATVSPNLLRNAGDEFDVTIHATGCVDYPLRVEVDFDWWTANGVDLPFTRNGQLLTERHQLSVGAIRADLQFDYDASRTHVVHLRVPSILYVPPPNPFYARAAAYAQMALQSPYRFLFGVGAAPSFPALLKVTERAGPDRVRLDQTLATRGSWQNQVRWFITLLPL